jgi:nucleoside-diphosphate-sugar epimerase
MSKSVVILTGSNGGIGSAIFKELNKDKFIIGLDISYKKNTALKNGYKIPMDLSKYVRC